MGDPERTSLETPFVKMALSPRRRAHFVFGPLIKFLVIVAAPRQIALGPRVASRFPSGLALSTWLFRATVPRFETFCIATCGDALSPRRRAHFVFVPLIKFLVVVAVLRQIALGPRAASRFPSDLALSKWQFRATVPRFWTPSGRGSGGAGSKRLSRLGAVLMRAIWWQQFHVFCRPPGRPEEGGRVSTFYIFRWPPFYGSLGPTWAAPGTPVGWAADFSEAPKVPQSLQVHQPDSPSIRYKSINPLQVHQFHWYKSLNRYKSINPTPCV